MLEASGMAGGGGGVGRRILGETSGIAGEPLFLLLYVVPPSVLGSVTY